MNPADDHNIPYLEIVRDTRGRWSWMLWDRDNTPICISSVTFDTPLDCARHLKKTRKNMKNAPTILYTNRRPAPSGRYTRKSLTDLKEQNGEPD